VIPKYLHVLNSDLDRFNIFHSFVDVVWMTELTSILTEVNDLLFEDIEFTEDATKFLKSIF